MESQYKVDIVMTVWDRPKFTQYAIQSIAQNTRFPCRLIVIDNGSKPELREYLSTLQRAGIIHTLILNEKNRGLEWAKHKAMAFVDSPYFVSTDNDILAYRYDPCWLEQLVSLAQRHPEYYAIGCRPQVLVATGNIFEGHEDEEILEFSHVPGYLRIMRTDWVRELGAWRDMRPLRGHEEHWISLKIQQAGGKVGWATKIRCWHLFGDGNWGYESDMKPEDHGHNPVSSLPKDDIVAVREGTGIEIGS